MPIEQARPPQQAGVICRISCHTNELTSSMMEGRGRERSRPRVKGTMQKAHKLSQPRMMLSQALICPWGLAGSTSSYVSVLLNVTLMGCCACASERLPLQFVLLLLLLGSCAPTPLLPAPDVLACSCGQRSFCQLHLPEQLGAAALGVQPIRASS